MGRLPLTLKSTVVTTSHGVPMLIRIVAKDERYGYLRKLGEERPCVATEDLVEFWDLRYPHDPEYKAQFVSRYYVETIWQHFGMLRLNGGVPEWDVDEMAMGRVHDLLRSWIGVHGIPKRWDPFADFKSIDSDRR